MQGYHPGAYYPPQYGPQTYVPPGPAGPYPYPPFQPVVPPPPQGYQQFPTYQPAQEQYEPPPPAPKPKHMRRSHTLGTATPNPKAVPLKSAMKKPQHDRSTSMGSRVNTPDLSRTSSRATSEQRHRANSNASRHRADSIPSIAGINHVFVTLHGASELRVDNVPNEDLVEEFRQTFPFAWPHGVAVEEKNRYRWRLQFSGTPWASSGTDSIIARNMICTMYQILANRGWSYLTTININAPPSRLVFLLTAPDPMAEFFSVLLSQSGEKLSLLGLHPQLSHQLGDSLRGVFPHKIASDRAREDGTYVIELRKGLGSDVDRTLFHAYVLRFFSNIGYKLDGSIPMGKAGPLGFGSRKELWIFRGSKQRSNSSLGQRGQ